MGTAVVPNENKAPGFVPAPEPEPIRKVSIICSKGSLDMAYPGLILANAARMSGIEAVLFFTFWGLDIITEKKIDHLQICPVGNPSMGMPTFLGGLPGMQSMATSMMKKTIDKLDIPPVRELIETLADSGAELYACKMAADMMELKKEDFVPQVKEVITAMDFFDYSKGANIIFI
ncbi:MAG: DsrE/DsrF/DrsH-like family protein [Polyangiaceae bacterium]